MAQLDEEQGNLAMQSAPRLDEKKERAEFEATEDGSDLTVLQGFDFTGQYADPNVQNRWVGWLRAKQAVAAEWVTV